MSKLEIHLSDDERQELTRIVSSGNHSARLIRRAQILLRSSDGWTDDAISVALGVSRQTVYMVRKQAVSDGVAASLNRKPGAKRAKSLRRSMAWPKPIW